MIPANILKKKSRLPMKGGTAQNPIYNFVVQI